MLEIQEGTMQGCENLKIASPDQTPMAVCTETGRSIPTITFNKNGELIRCFSCPRGKDTCPITPGNAEKINKLGEFGLLSPIM